MDILEITNSAMNTRSRTPHHLIILVIAIGALLSVSCHRSTKEVSPKEYYATCKPCTRWWWFSAELDNRDIRDQLVWLHDHGFGGVEIAWIYPMGLDSATAHPDFLSQEWASHVVFAKRIADSLGLSCDFTYGTLWPFSDVNLPDGDQARTYFDTVEPARRSYTWDFPREGRILNHLDKEAFNRYAAKMNKGLAEAYKGSRSGLFVDSWEVETQYLWTPGFGETFLKEHHYDIEPYLQDSTLYDEENAEIFYDYMKTLSGYVLREFYKPFAQNARKVGAFSRAQCGGAPTDLLTAFSLVDVPETEAILYEPSFSKIAASAAALANREVVSAEAFTCVYGWTSLRSQGGRGQSPYQGREQIADLKLICDALFANGTNQIIWHGFPYNKVGESTNHFYTTCQISTNEKQYLSGQALTDFNQYMTTVSEYMRKGKNYSDLAVYMPLEDAWMGGFYPDSLRKVKAFFWGEYEMRFIRTPEALKGMQPLWVNARFLKSATYENGVLHCGKANFRALYSDVEYMELNALKDLVRLAEAGMPLCLMRDPKEPGKIKHNATYQQMLNRLHRLANVQADTSVFQTKPLIEGNKLPDFWCRQDGETYYVFFANPWAKTIQYPLPYCYAFQNKKTMTREIIVNHHGKSETYTLTFRPTESILLKIDKKGIHPIDLAFLPKKR